MVRSSLSALIREDAEIARSVLKADDEVNQAHREMYARVKKAIQRRPEDAGRLIDLLMAARQLERIADHAVNIAEDVIYVVTGEMVRHNHQREDETLQP